MTDEWKKSKQREGESFGFKSGDLVTLRDWITVVTARDDELSAIATTTFYDARVGVYVCRDEECWFHNRSAERIFVPDVGVVWVTSSDMVKLS